jgi:hypothetical protein
MNKIEIHDLGESDKEFLIENVFNRIEKTENQAFEMFEQTLSKYSLSGYMTGCLEYINTLSVYTEDRASQTKLLYYWRVLSMAFYKLAYNAGEEVEVVFREKPVKHIAPAYRGHTDFAVWLDAYSAFMVLRDKRGKDLLSTVTKDSQERAEGKWTILNENMSKFFIELNNPESEILSDVYMEALESCDIKHGHFLNEQFAIDYVLDMHEPVLLLYYYVLTDEQEKFDEMLLLAVQRHRGYYDTDYDNRRIHAEGWVSWRLLGVCAFAYDRGMQINVESEYIPEWLYKGEFDESSIPAGTPWV